MQFSLLLVLLFSLISCYLQTSLESNFNDLFQHWDELSESEQEMHIAEATITWKLFLEELISDEEERNKVATSAKALRAVRSLFYEIAQRISRRSLSISAGIVVWLLVDYILKSLDEIDREREQQEKQLNKL